eukprot:152645_1
MSKYKVNQFIELEWRVDKFLYGNKNIRCDELLSKSTTQQRDKQFQFVVRTRDLLARQAIRKGLFPPDTWNSGRQPKVPAKSDRDINLITKFNEWLKCHNLSVKSKFDDVESFVWNRIGKFELNSDNTWVKLISANDLKKMCSGWELCSGPSKKAAYEDFLQFILLDIHNQKLSLIEDIQNE